MSSRAWIGFVVSASLLLLPACEGERGPAGPPGDATGTIAGTVRDPGGAALSGAAITTEPASSTAVSLGDGGFTLFDVPIGAYRVIATKEGFATAALDAVGVAYEATTQVSLVMAPEANLPASIEGIVKDFGDAPVAGATVTVSGQTVSAVTDANGGFLLEGVTPGFGYLHVAPPAGSTAVVAGGTREGTFIASGAKIAGVEILLSGRPGPTAGYVGSAQCVSCHPDFSNAMNGSAHRRSITPGQTRMIRTDLWPGIGATVNPGLTGLDPANGTSIVPIYLCNSSTLGYAMKFGGAASCGAGDGTLVPIAGTYGGEGDGGIGATKNLGTFKQRYLARLADVPSAAGWTYTEGKEKDWLVMPVQITQSGNLAKFDGYKGPDWAKRSRTFSRQCAGCHVQGLEVTLDASNNVTAYDFLDQNIGCETCHGPGEDHLAAVTGTTDTHLKRTTILMPEHLASEAGREVCGQCHAADSGKSLVPDGVFGYAWNASNAAATGRGAFVPGVWDLEDYIKGLYVPTFAGGGFDAWPDGLHGKAHRQQFTMLRLGIHANNPYDDLTCADCHSVHSLRQGPYRAVRESSAGTWELYGLLLDNNSLCLSCHAGHGPFADLTKTDVAILHESFGETATLDGADVTFTGEDIQFANARIADAVSMHMQEEASMGLAGYNPMNDAMPVGRCASCHMPKTGKSGGWTMGLDGSGATALAEGDEASHAFDVIWPWQSMLLKKATGGADTDIMPNSCGGCHPGSRLSGD